MQIWVNSVIIHFFNIFQPVVLPLGVLLVWQSLEVGKEISFHLLLIEEVVTLVDDSLEATAAYRPGSCRKSEGVKV